MTNIRVALLLFVTGVSALGCQPTMALGTTHVAMVQQQWQHYCARYQNVEGFNNDATPLGRQGWELVSVTSTADGYLTACFKRPSN
jgi:hypothetical protein